MSRTPLEWKEFYTSSSFSSKYDYSGRLGAWVDEEGTHFALWSPMAQEVHLRLFEHGSKEEDGTEDDCPSSDYNMIYGKNGVFSINSKKNLSGKYYDYLIKHEDGTVVTVDPYAVSCGVNGQRGQILDLSTTDPDGWTEDRPPAKTPETVICETHVKDFSWDKSGGFPEEQRGRFLAFTSQHTSLGDKPTGLTYLKELGVTHIQLLPIYDYASVDEAAAFANHLKGSENGEPYNWGYDPRNYFSPEGGLSSDPYRGEVRVRELKEAVMALHKAGFRVIMDVVFNHTYGIDTPLQRTAPWYHYRLKDDGSLSEGSFCGNDVATEMPMTHKFITDCVTYWAREYHLDGFRFDIMSLLDTGLMNDIKRNLDEEFGKDEKIVYGEAWNMKTYPSGDVVMSDKDHFTRLDTSIGYFNDNLRDAITGKAFEPDDPGFVEGTRDHQALKKGIMSCLGGDGIISNPSQSITFVSCHDNLTLWDKLSRVNGLHPVGDSEEKRLSENRLAAAIYLMTPGRPFFFLGEEGARTKNGDENSYNAAIEENAIHWDQLYAHKDLIDYYKGLIALRKRLPILCRKDSGVKDDFMIWAGDEDGLPEGLVFVQAKDSSGHLLFVYNGSEYNRKLSLPAGKWKLLADTDCSSYWQDETPHIESERIVSKPMSALILKKV
ncbi:type I pullulanase [Candidatus Weimeria sp. HCP3S3_B5]|uniref:type I pullulanase n=1 Tax=Candidatus Weimeria sp. HCP3S3_B5 TaxID=3438871 RepID=UPI003F8C8D2C